MPPSGSGSEVSATAPGLRGFLVRLAAIVAYNSLIGLLFALLRVNSLVPSMVYAQAIGLSIFAVARWLRRLRGPSLGGGGLVIAVPAGTVAGLLIASALLGVNPTHLVSEHPRLLALSLLGSLLFGAAAVYYFYARNAVAESHAQVREQALARTADAQRLAEANLKLLQAQIEPHFLFNTLSNVMQLIESEPPKARRMLANLTSYLRASLKRTRAGKTSLGEELDLVRAYLEIQEVRMGARLHYRIDASPELRALSLPPLLLQPLVENAIRHGLEPKPGGGAVEVRASRAGEALVLEVVDTGLGIAADGPPAGVGLANVRSRLHALSHGKGGFVISPNEPEGVRVRLELPLSCCRGEA